MSLYPFYSPPYCYAPEAPNHIALFDSLSNAHEMGADHTFIMKHLHEYLSQWREDVGSFAVGICKYLKTNLSLSIRIVQTVDCLPLIHQHAPPMGKRQITAILREKYPSSVCFHEQLLTLAAINQSLIQPFVGLVRGVSRWFQMEVEERNYSDPQVYELEYLVNALYAEQRYKFDTGLQISNAQGAEGILCLYRLAADLVSKVSEHLWRKLMQGVFYCLCNMGIGIGEASRYVYFCVGEMMAMRSTLMQTQAQMAWLIMPKVRRAAERQSPGEVENVLGLLRDGIVNLLASAWTVEMESFWLWRLKLACDLLSIEERRQLQLIREVRGVYREISKFISS